MDNFIQFIQEQFLLSNCFLCHSDCKLHIGLCQNCIDNLIINNHSCSRCATPLEQTVNNLDSLTLCGHCQKGEYSFNQVVSPYLYKNSMVDLIHQLKYHEKLYVARTLAILFEKQLRQTEKPDCLIPIPLHRNRIKQRGYNQATELAMHLGKLLSIETNINVVERSNETLSQQNLDAKARKENVKSAFSIIDMKQTDLSQYQHIAIVDDVMTTGSTVDSLAKLLKNFGVNKVDVWTISRA